MSDSEHICVLGGGSWGIALASMLDENGHDVRIWEYSNDDAEELATKRESAKRLPGVKLKNHILVTSDISVAAVGAEIFMFVVPSHTVRETALSLTEVCSSARLFVNCSKGIENESFSRMSEVICQTIPQATKRNTATLSGPSHAEEVSRRMPTSVVVGCESQAAADAAQSILSNQYFRVYTTTDIVGVELGGAVKNIIAIAAGICAGLGLGDNSAGALITRGLAEIVRLGERLGADPRTFSGLSGLGDLVTTCMSSHSRNRHVGKCIGCGQTLTQVLTDMVMVAEGVKTTESVYRLSRDLNVDMPITEQVYYILFQEKDPRIAVTELMNRDLKSEN
jgi:glycerol-3-phosphate dehydrogenase (NAD(P)+)